MAPETPKGVSSRLLSMKFMQRAVNSASSTPEADAPSSKKRKTFHSPAQAQVDASINHASIKAALDERDAARTAALQQHSTKDMHWVLKDPWGKAEPKPAQKSLNVVYVGYGDVDSSDEEEASALKGRTSSKTTQPDANGQNKDGSSGSSTSESDTDEQSPHDRKMSQKRSRSNSRNRQSFENTKAKEFRDKRKKKEVNLNKSTSLPSRGGISAGGGISSGGGNVCHQCKQPGHMIANCPQRTRGKGSKKT